MGQMHVWVSVLDHEVVLDLLRLDTEVGGVSSDLLDCGGPDRLAAAFMRGSSPAGPTGGGVHARPITCRTARRVRTLVRPRTPTVCANGVGSAHGRGADEQIVITHVGATGPVEVAR